MEMILGYMPLDQLYIFTTADFSDHTRPRKAKLAQNLARHTRNDENRRCQLLLMIATWPPSLDSG
jgi:hypothetical protein